MKRLLSALASATALSLVVCPPAFADDDDDGFTPVSDCGTVITEPGHYKLINDLIGCDVPDPMGNPIEYGVAIASSNVVLNLGGHTIRCLQGEQQDSFLFSFGVFSEPYLSNIQIKNGTVISCDLGANLNQSHGSTIKNMVFKSNGTGIEVLAGSNNQIKNNSALGSWNSGILATSYFGNPFWGGFFVAPGTGHKIHRNLTLFNGLAGIDANGIEDTAISCNRTERNSDGIVLLNTGSGNEVQKNVARDNFFSGIGLFGFDFPGFVDFPIPEGNTVRKNTALGNWEFDLAELEFSFGGFFEGFECLNTWNRNGYETQFAFEGCIAPSVRVQDDDDEGCAPRWSVFDYDDEENLLKDPSFEERLSPDEGGWMLFGASWFSFEYARSGQQSMFNGANFGGAGSFQEFPAEPGSQWRLTGYGFAPSAIAGLPESAFGIVQVSFFDEFGTDLGTVETMPGLAKISNPVDSTTPAGEWIYLDAGIATAPLGTATIQAFTLYIDFAGEGFQVVFFDDLKLCALEDDGECIELDDDDDDDDD